MKKDKSKAEQKVEERISYEAENGVLKIVGIKKFNASRGYSLFNDNLGAELGLDLAAGVVLEVRLDSLLSFEVNEFGASFSTRPYYEANVGEATVSAETVQQFNVEWTDNLDSFTTETETTFKLSASVSERDAFKIEAKETVGENNGIEYRKVDIQGTALGAVIYNHSEAAAFTMYRINPDPSINRGESVRFVQGTIVETRSDGSLLLSNGYVIRTDGSTKLPDGTIHYESGVVEYASGWRYDPNSKTWKLGDMDVGPRLGEGEDWFFGRVDPNFCFAAGTPVYMFDGSQKPIEEIKIDDEVLAYDASDRNGQGALSPRRVTRTYATPDKLVIDFHGLKVTPGHVFLCGDGEFAGEHRMLMEILRSDGTIVSAEGIVLRAATNAPVGSREDAFLQVAYLTDANDALMQSGRMRAGTLIFTAEGETRSVLACLEAEGYRFDAETGLVAKDGEEPHPLYWYGEIPRPEDYVLKRSDLTDADLYAEPGYRPEVATSQASSRLGQGHTPSEGLLYAEAGKQAGETIH